ITFRARSLDAAKPLPVYRNRELPESNHCLSISLAFPQMLTDGKRTGIGEENHPQRALLVIPLPEVEGTISYHDCLYKGEFQIPKQLIHNHSECLIELYFNLEQN
uniref:Uncharacterized protein n=1 Tax=Paramormyrops kingsleyae TaxID=1676925 RepID=A0A3B3SKI7_9TELE